MEIKTQTVIRTVVLIVALTNQILAITGKEQLPIYENDIVQALTVIATIVSSVWAWWKNNSFTEPALYADAYMEELRGQDDDLK